MLTHVLMASAALLVGAAGSVTVPASSEDSTVSLAARRDEVRLRAELGGSGLASGKADYRERERRSGLVRYLSVEIEDAAPNATFDVIAGGEFVGQITTNAMGWGEINLRTVTDDEGQQGPVPQLRPGNVVRVKGSGLSGAFAAR